MQNQFRLLATATLAAIFIVCLSALAFAQESKTSETEVKLPDTPAGKTVTAFLKAFNSGKLETMKKFHEDFGGNPENAERDLQAYEETGGLKLSKVISSEDYKLEVLVETKNGGNMNFTFTVREQSPHGLTSVRAQPAS